MALKPMMSNKLYCPRCNKTKDGPSFRVPGQSLGHIIVDQLVCSACHDAHHEHLENEFWRGASCLDKEKCPKCKERLTSHNCRAVYRRANNDGVREIHLVCDNCHADYKVCCKDAAEKCKGENNG